MILFVFVRVHITETLLGLLTDTEQLRVVDSLTSNLVLDADTVISGGSVKKYVGNKRINIGTLTDRRWV